MSFFYHILSTLFIGRHSRSTRERPSPDRLKPGQIVCSYCGGAGVYSNGYVRLSCHRCENGVTTPERQSTAEEWEEACALNSSRENKKEILERYRAARVEPL
jgi:hypothetical protein